jgi:hypothetical protein
MPGAAEARALYRVFLREGAPRAAAPPPPPPCVVPPPPGARRFASHATRSPRCPTLAHPAGAKFPNYNIREYVKLRARQGFEARAEPAEAARLWAQARDDLGVVKRQAVVYSVSSAASLSCQSKQKTS